MYVYQEESKMALGTEALARASAKKPWRTLGIWVVLLILAGVASSALLGDALTASIEFTNSPDSARAQQLIEEIRGEPGDSEFVVVASETATVEDPNYIAYVTEIQTTLASSTAVNSVGSYLTQDGPVSDSGSAALLPVELAGSDIDEFSANAELLRTEVHAIPVPDGFEALVAGPATFNNDFNTVGEEDLRTGETIGIIVALIVLVFVFGTVVSGVIPLILGVVSIAIAMGLAALVGQVFDLSFFITNMITMIGLAVGIDYSLFIVSRYREERQRGFEKLEAIGRSGATATRAVFFSGMTVVLALVGMLLVPNTLFRSLGLGAILVVVAAVLASMTLLPAVLSLMGDKVDALRVRRRGSLENHGRYWDRITKTVMARPVISMMLSVAVLLVFASSFFSIETGLAGVSTMPAEIESAQAFAVLEEEFEGGLTSPVEVVVSGGDVGATVAKLETALAGEPGFGPIAIDPASTEDIVALSVQLPGDVASAESMETVRRLRDFIVPDAIAGGSEVFVGGQTAITIDLVDQTNDYTPIVFAVVLGLSFLLLMVAFRSIVIPGKAIVMNLLSVAAAYGLVVAFFQTGVGPEWVKSIASALGFTQVDAIEAWIPLFLFSVLFGLSMDYHVFLLSRIKERFDITGDNTESVAYGLRTTGALITGAAAIMVAVFAGFAAGRLTSFQQMGFGLAVAVLLDATIVRTILVPATMKLLGSRNWYFPSWLEWIPNVSIEGHLDDPDFEISLKEEALVG
jgi:RND superfamily putative drug exporter